MHRNKLEAQVQELKYAATALDTSAWLRSLDGQGWIAPLDSECLVDLADQALSSASSSTGTILSDAPSQMDTWSRNA